MDIIPFLKINADYYVLITNEVKECVELSPTLFFNKSMFAILEQNIKIKKGIVNVLLQQANIKVKTDYFIFKDAKTIVLYKKKSLLESVFYENQDYEYYLGLDKINNFRIRNKSFLLENLFNERENRINVCLDILAKYCFCNEYSLWLYNGITKVMTREASSKNDGHDFADKASNTTLFDFIESGLQYEIRKPIKEFANKVGFGKMNTLNRILIPLDNNGNKEYYGILNFYSLLENYNIKDETIKFIQSFLKTRMIEKRESIHLALERFEKKLSIP